MPKSVSTPGVIPDDPLAIAKNCRHYAMCKIDYLGTGVCGSGLEKHYASYFPQGRMTLYAALAEGKIPVSEQALDIADRCDLCGKCDYQCYFYTELRPSRAMQALKDFVDRHRQSGGAIEKPREDGLIRDIRAVVGYEWASNDPATTFVYSVDPFPLAPPRTPAAVALPGSKDEVAALVKLLNAKGVPWIVRGNASQNAGYILTDGVVLDLHRMGGIAFDEKNWVVKVGPGVSAFELQTEAVRRGFRVNVAEPAALVCANQMCSGIFTTFMPAYGMGGSNCVDAEFVAADGSFFKLGEKSAPNLFAFDQDDRPVPGICTSLSVKLHPTTDDETGCLVPFDSLEKAVRFAYECSVRRIGLAIGILGEEYISEFLAPTQRLAAEVRDVFANKLGISHLVLVVGDKYAIQNVSAMGYPAFSQRMFRALALGVPALPTGRWLDLLTQMSAKEPFAYLKVKGIEDLAEAALSPSPAHLAEAMDADLRARFEEIYARPEMTDLVRLNMIRILSSRMGREKQFFINIIYMPLEFQLIDEISAGFKEIADRRELKNGLGFISPIDEGKRCLLEYDYFFDHTDPGEIERMRQAGMEAGGLVMQYAAKLGTIRWMRHIVYQGFSRMENILYT